MGDLEVDRALYITGRLRGLSHPTASEQTEWGTTCSASTRSVGSGSTASPADSTDSRPSVGRSSGIPACSSSTSRRTSSTPSKRRLVWDLIRQLNQERGMTVILVTHNVLEAERVIDRVGIVSRGKLVALGTRVI